MARKHSSPIGRTYPKHFGVKSKTEHLLTVQDFGKGTQRFNRSGVSKRGTDYLKSKGIPHHNYIGNGASSHTGAKIGLGVAAAGAAGYGGYKLYKHHQAHVGVNQEQLFHGTKDRLGH